MRDYHRPFNCTALYYLTESLKNLLKICLLWNIKSDMRISLGIRLFPNASETANYTLENNFVDLTSILCSYI